MPGHVECFPLVWERPKRQNVPVEHVPLECVRWRVYCNVSVLESWGNKGKAEKVKKE